DVDAGMRFIGGSDSDLSPGEIAGLVERPAVRHREPVRRPRRESTDPGQHLRGDRKRRTQGERVTHDVAPYHLAHLGVAELEAVEYGGESADLGVVGLEPGNLA